MGNTGHETIVRQFLSAMGQGDTATMRALGVADAAVRIMGHSPISKNQTLEDFASQLDKFNPQVRLPFEVMIERITSQEDRTVAECASKIEFNNGHVYRNQYSYVFTFRDDRIAELREYTDTATAISSFSTLEPVI